MHSELEINRKQNFVMNNRIASIVMMFFVVRVCLSIVINYLKDFRLFIYFLYIVYSIISALSSVEILFIIIWNSRCSEIPFFFCFRISYFIFSFSVQRSGSEWWNLEDRSSILIIDSKPKKMEFNEMANWNT